MDVITVRMTPEQLVKALSLDKTAAKVRSYEDFVCAIKIKKNEYIRAYEADNKGIKVEDIYYMTIASWKNEHHADAESIAWFYILSNPDRALQFLDLSRRNLLNKFLKSDPSKYKEKSCYYDNKSIMKELQCSEELVYCMIALWEMQSAFMDAERTQCNLKYLLLEVGDIEDAKEFYSYFMQCSEEKAADDIESFLDKKTKPLRKMYPQGEPNIERREFCICKRFEKKDQKSDWIELDHLFFNKHSSAPARSAGLLYDYISPSYWSRNFTKCYGFKDNMKIEGHNCGAMETTDYCRIEKWEQYSYHDGGGGYRDILEFSYVTGVAAPKKLLRDKRYNGHAIPECKGYWETDGCVYLLNPFKMKGVFKFCTGCKSWDLDGDETWEGIGVEIGKKIK